MLSKVNSAGLWGIEAYPIEIEVDVSGGLPTEAVVGLPDAAVKESRDRVRTAISNSGFTYPDDKITVNLAPADVKKEGPSFDLPIALYDKVGNRLTEKLSDGVGIYYTYNELNQLTARGQSSPGDPSLVTNIKGEVSDVDHLGATAQVDSVAVNGVAAAIYPNVGRFRAEGVTLQPGPNTITATAKDRAGNTATATITTTLLSGEPITYEYDRNGCLTKKTVPEVGQTIYEYDFENRLTKVTLPGGATNEFAYDGDKRRISKKNTAGEVTKFLYDGINILEDYADGGAVHAYYVQGIGIDKLIKRVTDAGSEYYHSDALGSVRLLTAEAGNQVGTYQYDAWGKITGSTGQSSNEYKFTSRRWEEEIGLQYNRARFYDPETGRFTTPDPLTGGPDDPTISYFCGIYSIFHRFIKEHVDALQPDKLNRYVYCYNNPVNHIDPLGLQAEEDQTTEVRIEAEEEKEGKKIAEFTGQSRPVPMPVPEPRQTPNPSKTVEEVKGDILETIWEIVSWPFRSRTDEEKKEILRDYLDPNSNINIHYRDIIRERKEQRDALQTRGYTDPYREEFRFTEKPSVAGKVAEFAAGALPTQGDPPFIRRTDAAAPIAAIGVSAQDSILRVGIGERGSRHYTTIVERSRSTDTRRWHTYTYHISSSQQQINSWPPTRSEVHLSEQQARIALGFTDP